MEDSPIVGPRTLTAIAGGTDALVMLHAKELLAVYMTGNTTKLGQSIVRLEGSTAAPLAAVVAIFLAATTAAARGGDRLGPRRAPVLLGCVAVLLGVAQATAGPRYTFVTLALIAAAMAALNQVLPDEPGVTFVTGSLVKLGRALAGGRGGEAAGLSLRWAAFLSGAIVATLVDERLHRPSLALVALAALVTAALAARTRTP